jgi:hypothetical protein
MFKVYHYDVLEAGIRCDAITGKDIVMNGNTYMYICDLYLTGNIHRGRFSGAETCTEQRN